MAHNMTKTSIFIQGIAPVFRNHRWTDPGYFGRHLL
jgi:hypothetical protein